MWWVGGGDSIRTSLGGAPMLELRWRWTPAEALALLEPLAYAERVRYLRFQYLDLVFPIVYAAALSLGIAFQLGAAERPGRWTRWLALLPVGVLAADWWENVNLVGALQVIDERPVGALARAAAGTTAKWAAFCATVLIYAAAFAWRGLQREAR